MIDLVSLLDSLEIKVDYLLEKDLGISIEIQESSSQLLKEDEKSENVNLLRERRGSPNTFLNETEKFKLSFNNGV